MCFCFLVLDCSLRFCFWGLEFLLLFKELFCFRVWGLRVLGCLGLEF